MSIWKQFACLLGSEDRVTDPPEKVLGLMVIDGVAYAAIHELGDMERIGPEEYHFKMPARALLHILQSAIAADEDPQLTTALDKLNDDFRQRLASHDDDRPHR